MNFKKGTQGCYQGGGGAAGAFANLALKVTKKLRPVILDSMFLPPLQTVRGATNPLLLHQFKGILILPPCF